MSSLYRKTTAQRSMFFSPCGPCTRSQPCEVEHKGRLGAASLFLDEKKLLYQSGIEPKKKMRLNRACPWWHPGLEGPMTEHFSQCLWVHGHRGINVLSASSLGVATGSPSIDHTPFFSQYKYHFPLSSFFCVNLMRWRRLENGAGAGGDSLL